MLPGLRHFLRETLKPVGLDASLAILGVEPKSSTAYHARFSATEREYIYRLVAGTAQCGGRQAGLFEAARSWIVQEDTLDLESMRAAANILQGQHDFSSFRGRDCTAATPIRTLTELSVHSSRSSVLLGHVAPPGSMQIFISARAPSFIKNQVRNLVGCLYDVGRGSMAINDVQEILQARDRSKAPRMAPAQGLFLVNVLYNGSWTSECRI